MTFTADWQQVQADIGDEIAEREGFSPPTGKPLSLADDLNIAVSIMNESVALNKALLAQISALIETIGNIAAPRRSRFRRLTDVVLFIGLLGSCLVMGIFVQRLISNGWRL